MKEVDEANELQILNSIVKQRNDSVLKPNKCSSSKTNRR